MNLPSHWIRTASGCRFDYLDPRPEQIEIEDIAHALASIPRYVGHSPLPVSVAEHSVRVCRILPRKLQLVGLMHDATEAYVLDLPSPLKALLPDYQAIEKRVWAAIAARFSLPLEFPAEIKAADRVVLATEVCCYFPQMQRDLPAAPPPLREDWSAPWDRALAKEQFLDAFDALQEF